MGREVDMDFMEYGIIYSGERTDWVDEQGNKRTRRNHRYAYDAHYVWREFNKNKQPKSIDAVYSDRMREWDGPLYESCITKDTGWIEDISKEEAKRIIHEYYDGTMECVGFARECNQSSGYGIGLFFIKPIKAKKVKTK
jgi:hypothetical protein